MIAAELESKYASAGYLVPANPLVAGLLEDAGFDGRDDVWLSAQTFMPEIVPRLLPHMKPLEFHDAFIQAVVEAPKEIGTGAYAMGWEL